MLRASDAEVHGVVERAESSSLQDHLRTHRSCGWVERRERYRTRTCAPDNNGDRRGVAEAIDASNGEGDRIGAALRVAVSEGKRLIPLCVRGLISRELRTGNILIAPINRCRL